MIDPYEERSTLKSIDVLMDKCIREKHTFANLSKVFSLVGLKI